jgi:hypothetical protein
MSNPVVTVTNDIPAPSDLTTTRNTYMLKTFESIDFFRYPQGENSGNFDPLKMGPEFYLWYMMGECAGVSTPTFITAGSWVGLAAAPSGYITPNNSIMPKLVGPSTLLVNNGLKTAGTGSQGVFNWVLETVDGVAPGVNWHEYAQVSSNYDAQYVTVNAKNDAAASSEVVISLDNENVIAPVEFENLVVNGAFHLLLNILGTTPGQVDPELLEANKWNIEIVFGDVTLTIVDAGTMKVKIAGEDNETTVNLAEGVAKEGPPQASHMPDKTPMIIGVYPCWNGIVVTSGQQETPEVVKTASTFCIRKKGASIQDPARTTPAGFFDLNNPGNVAVNYDADVKVEFGTKMTVTAKNCRFEIAYLPKFHTPYLSLDGWLLLADDTDDINFSYALYMIWTANGTSYAINTPSMTDSGTAGAMEGTSYWYTPYDLKTGTLDVFERRAGEIFAYILKTTETKKFGIKNGNGNFILNWTGGTPGGNGGNWKDYIKNVSVTIGMDGSSGSITVDKYGVAGQEAVAKQSIGAIVLSATGGVGTTGGTIFKGIAMGIGSNESSGDALWTIPLVGIEKKLEDIELINPPFMDGETLATAVGYLCKYAGINFDLSDANSGVHLSGTEEISAARFDWKSGTSVKTALEDVLEDVNHGYLVFDGIVKIYEKGVNGLPLNPGTSHVVRDSTKTVARDNTPDFEDLRNYIVAMSLQKISDGTGAKVENGVSYPLIEARTRNTTPDVPWAKCYVRVLPGILEESVLSNIVDNMSDGSGMYEMIGKITIAGDASIKPLDQYGSDIIFSVTHNIDLQAKTWTTDIELMRDYE